MAQVVVMEGALKKRGATMPVMHDRYCVATLEAGGAVVLRTFKSRAAYAEAPHKPLEPAQRVKCVGAWDGKGHFHKYPFGFTLETRESKLLLCAAPSREAQRQWLELMNATTQADDDNDSGSHTTSSGQRQSRVADKTALFDEDQDDEEDVNYGKAAVAAVQHARRFEQEPFPRAENDLLSDDDDYDDDDHDDDDHHGAGYGSDDDDRRRRPVSPLALSPPDDKLLFRAGSTESLTSSLGNRNGDEPDDWGLYGDDAGQDGPSRYDVVDGPVLSLDTDLLNGAPKTAAAPLASDDFLFEQNGPTFGAVVVPASSGGAGAGDDFVDPVLQERLARKHKEKQLKRVTKKLESNRDLYAEMAAARLKSMRKDAKTKPRPSVVHRRRGEDDDDDDDDEDGWSDGETVDDERYRAVSAAETSRTSKTSTPKAHTPHAASSSTFELEEIDSEDEPFIKRQSLQETAEKKKKSKKSSKTRDEPNVEQQHEEQRQEQDGEAVETSASGGMFGEDDFLFGEASMPTEPTAENNAPAAAETEEVDEEEARRRRREKRRLRRLQQEQEEAARLELVERKRQASVTSGPLPDEPVRRSSMDDQWQRTAESQKRKEERRRARKEKARQEAEAAAAAEELARQHREEMRRLEDEDLKQERRERKERKKLKEKSALEKKAKELKKKEAELLAEAEKLKQSQEALLKADEIKDVSRKTKRRDKYTSPTERIQRRDKEVEQAAIASASNSETAMSTALVVVEPVPAAVSAATMTEPSSVPATTVAVEPVAAAAPPASAPVVLAPAATTPTAAEPAATPAPPLSAPAAPPATSDATAPAQSSIPMAPQSAPTMQMPMGFPQQAQFAPGYPGATPFAMPMTYAAPYSAVHYTQAGFPAVPYGPGVAMPTPYYPHLGYVGGIAPMSAPGQMQAFAMMQPPSSSVVSSAEEEERFIGPQLPSPKSFHVDHAPAPAPAPSAVSSSAPASKAPSSIGSLPELPDVAAF